MAGLRDNNEVNVATKEKEKRNEEKEKEVTDLPPSGPSLHKRRRGEAPAHLSVKPHTPSDPEGSSPCTSGQFTEEYWDDKDVFDPDTICDTIIQKYKGKDDLPSKRASDLAKCTKESLLIVDQFEKLLELLEHFTKIRDENEIVLKKLRDVNDLKRLHEAYKVIQKKNDLLKDDYRQIQAFNMALDAEIEAEYGVAVLVSMIAGGRAMKRSSSKWKYHSKFGSSLLRKQRSRSAGGDDSDAPPTTPLRRKSEGIFFKEVEKSKVSKWTKVKAAFRWEKAESVASISGAAGAVAAGAMVGAVAIAGSNPSSTLHSPDSKEAAASLTPGSALSLSPNSSCEELRLDSGTSRKSLRCEEIDNAYLHAPTQDDSSTSPSPNKLHKGAWGKMRDIIHPSRGSIRKKSRGAKNSPDVIPSRRRSFSDGGDSDAPPVLTLTIPSSEELESDPHPLLRKQRSLELGARPPLHRPPRASKWLKVKKVFLTSASASVPSSPNSHSAFFTDAETEGLSSGCEASGFKEEIARDYAALQNRLGREFSDRRGKLSSGITTCRPVATEEQLSTEFRKKLDEWKLIKGGKQPKPVPARQDLSDDFLKKLDAWNHMKETNSVPAWAEESKRDEVLVRTSTGHFKFQGISRSFTRKLHEWEKSRGIAPEASTSALLKAAKAGTTKNKTTSERAAPLTRAQSDGSVAPSANGSGRLHISSLSVNDAEDIDSEYERNVKISHDTGEDECDGDNSRGAVIVEFEDEEICTASSLMAVTPKNTPQKPIYTYGQAEERLLCETSSAITGTAIIQPNGSVTLSESRGAKPKDTATKIKSARDQSKRSDKNTRTRKLGRQPSIEEDAKFIRKTIEEIERGSSSRYAEEIDLNIDEIICEDNTAKQPISVVHSTSDNSLRKYTPVMEIVENNCEQNESEKKNNADKLNGKKKSKSRARLEREHSKPSESDSGPHVDTVTVEIPRRRKKARRPSERPKTPPTSLLSDSEGEIFVLKLKAPEPRDGSPEVIVKTTRKIFSPVVRSGESVPRAVIPVDVDDLPEVCPLDQVSQAKTENKKTRSLKSQKPRELNSRSKSSGDLQESENLKTRNRPPLPLSPPSQRKPPTKETAPSIRIMIQRYNMKINDDGNTSGPSSGASSPAWRSPSAERRRPPDMPVGINIRNNPFLEKEVQKSASACQLSRKGQILNDKHVSSEQNIEGVSKSHSTNALHPETHMIENKADASLETLKEATASTDTIVPNHKFIYSNTTNEVKTIPIFRQFSDTIVPKLSKVLYENPEFSSTTSSLGQANRSQINSAAELSERAAKLRAAKEKFLSSPIAMRREGTSSAHDLRPENRLSQISCGSDITESHSAAIPEAGIARSISTGMVNVDRDAWERLAEGRREGRSRSKFSIARLAAKLRRKEDGAVARLCRQSLLVHLKNKQS